MPRRLPPAFLATLAIIFVASPASAAWLPTGNLVGYGPGDQTEEQICSDEAGGALIAWRDVATFPYRVRVTRLLANGTTAAGFPANGLRVAGTLGMVAAPSIASDGAGGAFLVWRDERSGTSTDLYAQHVLANGALAPGWPLYGLPVSSGSSKPAIEKIVADGQGGCVVEWYDTRYAPDPSPTGLYALRMNADGTLASGWTVDGTLVSTTGWFATLVADGSGGALIGWYRDSGSPTNKSDVYVQRLLGDGTVAPGWPATGFLACNAAYDQFLSSAAPDGAGGVYLAFGDYRLNDNRVHLYGQHVTSAGAVAPGWAASGNAICVGPQNQEQSRIVPDGTGGAIFVWLDWREAFSTSTPNNTDIYAQRVTTNGIALWGINGVAACAQTSPQWSPAVAADGTGGALVSWVDYRPAQGGSPTGNYATHLDAAGQLAPGWTLDGVSITQPASVGNTSMVPDGAGGAIVAWHAYTLSSDVIATHLSAYGIAATDVEPAPAPSAEFAIAGVSPNPASGAFRVEFSLPGRERATLELIDLAGRRIETQEVGGLGPGRHMATLGRGAALAPGVYRVRLQRGGESRVKAIAIVR